MDTNQQEQSKKIFINNTVEAVIRVGILLLLVGWCFDIARPFLYMIIWGVIIAVASYPLYTRLCNYLSGRQILTSIVFTLTLLSIILVPSIILSASAVEGATQLAQQLEAGDFVITPPPQSIKSIPLIGTQLSDLWTLASENITAALGSIQPQLKSAGLSLLQMIKSAGIGFFSLIAAIIIAGMILANAKSGKQLAQRFALRIVGEQGYQYTELSSKLIQSVTLGILGLSIIQSLLAGIGFMVMSVPAAGFWAFLCLLFGIIQVGALPVILGVAIYVMSTVDTLPGILFLVWSIGIGVIDNIFKPILFSRGVDVPMLVIFIGAIGGLLSMGIIGLFLGAVVLALGYSLLVKWLAEAESLP